MSPPRVSSSIRDPNRITFPSAPKISRTVPGFPSGKKGQHLLRIIEDQILEACMPEFRYRNWPSLLRFFHISVPTPPIRLPRKAFRSSPDLRRTLRTERLLAPPTRIFTNTSGT